MRRRRAQIFGRRRRRAWLIPVVLSGLVAIGFLLFAAVGSRNEANRSAPEVGPLHVHALGVNPGDGAAYIAAHTGLFRLSQGATNPKRVGDRRQDTMGFTVVGPNRFIAQQRDRAPILGSGHPDLRGQPAAAPRAADFHVLRVRGTRIVGYDSSFAPLSRDSITADA